MNLQEFDFTIPSGVFPADPVLIKEAQDRGFYKGHTPYNRLFNELFYEGGKLNYKPSLPDDFRKAATAYLKSLIAAWKPRLYEKEAIGALILSELVETGA